MRIPLLPGPSALLRWSRRRWLLAVTVVAALALLVGVGPLAMLDAIRDWLLLEAYSGEDARALVSATARRQERLLALEPLLALDPVLPVAALTAGLGSGIVAGAVGTFLYKRRRIRRGEWDA